MGKLHAVAGSASFGIARVRNYPPERPILPGDVRAQADQDAQELRDWLGSVPGRSGPVLDIISILDHPVIRGSSVVVASLWMRSSARRGRSRGSDRVRRRGSLARPAARGRWCPDALRTGQTRGTGRPNRRLSGRSSVPGRAATSRTSGAPKCCAPLRISAPPLAGFAGRAGARSSTRHDSPRSIRSIFDTNTEAAP